MSLKRPPQVPARTLTDETVLSQYGRESGAKPVFRSGPRADRETAQSLSIGPCTVEEIARKVLGRPCQASDRVRETTVGRLRAAGFDVMSTPTGRNRDHVSITVPGSRVPWDDAEQERFDSCFE